MSFIITFFQLHLQKKSLLLAICFSNFSLPTCKCWPEAPIPGYGWKVHSKATTTIQLQVYVVKSGLFFSKFWNFSILRKLLWLHPLHDVACSLKSLHNLSYTITFEWIVVDKRNFVCMHVWLIWAKDINVIFSLSH